MCRLERILKNLLRASKKSRAWRTFISCLAAIVVFVTTYSLILPAITVEKSATEDVVGLVMEEADPGSTGAGTETPEEAVIVEAEYEIPDEIVQEKTSDDVVPEEIPDETPQEETSAPNGRTNPAGSASSSAESASSSAESTTAEEVKELKNGEVQTVGDRRVMILTGEDYDVVVSGDLSAGVSDGTVLSVREISDADVVRSFSDRITDEFFKIFVDTKTTEVLYQLVFTDGDLVEYSPAGNFDVQFIFHNNTVSHTDEVVCAAIYDHLTDEMVLTEKNGDAYETPVISFNEYGIITGITLKGLNFGEYSDIITLVAGPVNEERKLAAEQEEDSAATDSKNESSAESAESGSKNENSTESAESGSKNENSTESAESDNRTESGTEPADSDGKTESSSESAKSETEKTESTGTKTDSADSRSEGPSEKAETSKESGKAGSGTLTVRGRDYTVTLAYSAAAEIPADAALEVTEIENGTGAYKKYLAQAKAAMGLDKDQVLPKEQARFFDIRIMADGKEVQPAANVSVNITYDQPVAEADPGAEAQINASAVHFGKEGAEVVEVSDADASRVEFEAESFSVYGVIYTVDFEYNGYFYKLPGGEMMLSELVEALGIAGDGQKYTSGSAFVADVLDAEFSNPDLLEVTKAGFFGLFSDDWILKTKESFVTEETLTITMKDSSRYVIKVTDPVESTNLSDFLKNVVIAGAVQDSTGAYIVEKGVHYNLIATFTEDSAYQFKNDGTLTYQLPDGVEVLAEQSGTMNINVVYKGKTYQVEADYHLGTDGRLEIEFDQSDTDYHRLAASTNVSFRFIFDAVFDGDTTRIKFSDNVERDIVFEEPKGGQAYATKSAEYDERTGIFHYTITVTADGDCTNVNVRDVISGNAVIFNNDVQVSGNSSSYTDNWAPNGFDYTFASMADGEEITITYTGRADFSKDMDNDGKLTVDQTKNTVTAQPEGGDPHKGEYSREIRYKWTTKSNGTEAGLTESGDKIIEWTIDYNELSLASVKGDTITDTISADSTGYMKYYGTEITVNVYDHSGNLVDTRYVPYTSLTSHSDSSWTYTIPETDTESYHYQIVYQTVVDMEKVNGGGTVVTLNNTANGDGGKIDVTPDNLVDITKDVESFTTEEVNWVATLSVPEGGLTQAVVVDTLPVLYWHGKNIYDLYKEGSLDISGYLDGESYEVSYETGKVTITFYKGEGADKTTGLLGVQGGHTITIRLTTTVDQEWLAVGYDGGETEPGWARWLMDHQNSISIGSHTAYATVTFDKPDIEKTAEVYKDGQGKVTSILYTLTLTGVSDVPVNIEDTFDTSLLEIDTSKTGYWFHMNLWGGNQYYQDAGPIPVSYADTSNGVLITANTVPMQANGNYYSHYKITYYVKLKDGVDLDALAIANGGEHELTNTAKWGDHESSYTYKTVYDYFDKKLLNENELGGTNRTARYQISFNPAKAMLNQGEPMTLTDVMSPKLSLDYSSVSITTDPEGVPVPYSATGRDDGTTVVRYTIPDSTAVTITYEAMVVGNGPVTITNDADINGKEEHTESTKIYGGAGEGDAAVASFKIVKVDGYDASKKLEGVQFRLFAENLDLSFDSEGTKELILTSDENGEVIIDGDVFEIFFGEVYHLQEIEPLDGYGTISFDYLITLVSDMSLVDYNHYVYYYSDSMQIKNWPLEGLVVEKNVESTDEADLKANYHFKISILDDNGEVDISYNEKNGEDQFENGVFEFILKNREQKMFWGFERGTRYRVEEILTDEEGNEFTTTVGYDTFDEDGNVVEHMTETGRSHTGELTQETETIVFTNKKATKIGFEKIWMNNNASTKWAEDTSITVTVSGGDKTYTYTISRRDLTVGNEISGKKGDPKLTVRTVREDDQTKTYKYQFEVKGLPYNNGVSYKVTERKVDKYKDPVYKAGEVDTPDGAMDGGAIINIAEESYELPESGGMGIAIFYIVGAVLLFGAGVLLVTRRRMSV
ncbi:MAG: hypothetical protein J6D46_07570 [Lachnospiraceae bacterium]|nr:hypothetical protein [Lachnospiraceae bacterium]